MNTLKNFMLLIIVYPWLLQSVFLDCHSWHTGLSYICRHSFEQNIWDTFFQSWVQGCKFKKKRLWYGKISIFKINEDLLLVIGVLFFSLFMDVKKFITKWCSSGAVILLVSFHLAVAHILSCFTLFFPVSAWWLSNFTNLFH